ncbi:MAG: plasmid mobilization relaxosome protein MobC [Eubacteriales bacterium]
MNKTTSISFRVTETEKRKIKSRAKKLHMKTSDFCRMTALRKEINIIEGLREFIPHINKVGNNLNQIAILMHQNRINNPLLDDIKNDLSALVADIRKTLGGDDNRNS